MKSVHPTIIRQSNSIQKRPTHHARFPRLPCIYKSTKAIGSLGEYFAVKETKFSCVPVDCSCLVFGVFVLVIPGPAAWSCCLVLLPGPAAWSCCLVLLPGPAAWSGLVLSDPAWFVFVLSGYLACRILVVPFSKIQQRPAANSRWAG
jgi:hypothetical protein